MNSKETRDHTTTTRLIIKISNKKYYVYNIYSREMKEIYVKETSLKEKIYMILKFL